MKIRKGNCLKLCKKRVQLVFYPTFFIRCKTLSNFLLLSLSPKTTEDRAAESRGEWETNENWIAPICPAIKEQKMRQKELNHLQIYWKKTWEKVFCRPDYNWGKVLRVGGCPLGKTYEKLKQTIQEMFLCAHNLRHIHSGHIFSKFLSHPPHVQKVTLLARAISSESLLLVSTWSLGACTIRFYQLLSFPPGVLFMFSPVFFVFAFSFAVGYCFVYSTLYVHMLW